jgi:hypothetical protein
MIPKLWNLKGIVGKRDVSPKPQLKTIKLKKITKQM